MNTDVTLEAPCVCSVLVLMSQGPLTLVSPQCHLCPPGLFRHPTREGSIHRLMEMSNHCGHREDCGVITSPSSFQSVPPFLPLPAGMGTVPSSWSCW